MANGFLRVTNGISIPGSTTQGSVLGDLRVDSASSSLKFYDGSREISLLESGRPYNVKDYGAVGDGVTNDSSAINSAIAAVGTSGGKVFFPAGTYLCNADLVCTVSNTWILGEGKSSKIVFADGINLEISSSDVRVSDLWLDGQNYSTGTSTGNIIQARGATASSYIENIVVERCHITNVPYQAIEMQFVENFRISDNYIENIYYSGVAILSCSFGEISRNTVRDMDKNSIGSGNSYGIFISRTAGSLSTYPRSKSILICDNVIDNNPTWEGLDTHCGQDLVFANNIVTRCKSGIVVGAEGGSPTINPPLRCVVVGNTIDSQITSGSASYGIVVQGDFTNNDYAEACVVSGNSISRHGLATASTGCALYFYATRGLVVTGNTIEEAGANAIYLSLENYGFNISNNVIVDAWSNTIGRGTGIYSNDNDQTGYIGGNVFVTGTKSATSVMTQAINFPSGPSGYDITLGDNHWSGSTSSYLVNATTGVSAKRRLTIGSVSAPSLTFRSDETTGIYSEASGSINFGSGGVAVARFLNSGGPNLQFKTSTASTAFIYQAVDTGSMNLSGGSGSAAGANIQLFGGSHSTSANLTTIRANGQTVVSITSVSATITGTVTGDSFIPTSATAPTNGLYLVSTNTLGISANSTAMMRILSSAGPNLRFENTISAGSYIYQAVNTGFASWSGGNGNTAGRNFIAYGGAHASKPGRLEIRADSTVQMEITSAGAFTIGSASSTVQHAINGLSSTTATAGTVHTVPTTAVEYLVLTINGATRKIALFAS